jgi:hypothetical protein
LIRTHPRLGETSELVNGRLVVNQKVFPGRIGFYFEAASFVHFRLLSEMVVFYSKTESKISKMKRDERRGRVFGPNF